LQQHLGFPVDGRNPDFVTTAPNVLRDADPVAPHTLTVGGLPTAVLTRAELAEVMIADCLTARAAGRSWKPRLVFSSNGQGIVLNARDPAFAKAMAAAGIVHADGMPVVLATRLLLGSKRLPERIATTDFINDACLVAERHGLSFYFLGGREEDNLGAARWFKSRHPGLEIVGRHHGYYAPTDEDRIIAEIADLRPDVVWVGLGKPRQEFLALKLRDRLGGVGWIKTCGGMFDYHSGRSRRAPLWMQQFGLEWLFRGLQEPRLLKRYLATNLSAAYLLLTRTRS
jgi:exopolysaccharide biosynthesis WecB/TagA/CpsF family protein